jgi:hypothetical protein
MVMNNLSMLAETLFPQLGCAELKNSVGMIVAIVTLATSLCPGQNSTNIQQDMMRKEQTWISNAHDASREYLCKMIIGLNRTKQYVTSCHTFWKWFSRFMQGACLRMGMISENEALTSTLVLAVCRAAEAKWLLVTNEKNREQLEETVCLIMVAFGGLRGEEVLLLSMDGMLTFREESWFKQDRFIMLTLKGHFKGKVDKRWHMVSVSNYTRSQLPG